MRVCVNKRARVRSCPPFFTFLFVFQGLWKEQKRDGRAGSRARDGRERSPEIMRRR